MRQCDQRSLGLLFDRVIGAADLDIEPVAEDGRQRRQPGPGLGQLVVAQGDVERPAAPAGPAVPQGAMGAGTEGRLWADPDGPPPVKPTTPYKVTVTEDVKIAMRDGVKLDAMVYVPERRRPAGCLLVFDGYGRSFDPRDRRFAEEQGYAVVNVSTRGIFKSEGKAGLYDLEADPGETKNLAPQEPGISKRLAGLIEQAKATRSTRPRPSTCGSARRSAGTAPRCAARAVRSSGS